MSATSSVSASPQPLAPSAPQAQSASPIDLQVISLLDRNLIRFTKWFIAHSPSAAELLSTTVTEGPPNASQAERIRKIFDAHQTLGCDLPFYGWTRATKTFHALWTKESGTFEAPLEMLNLNLPPECLAVALDRSVRRSHIPFVTALVRSEKAADIPPTLREVLDNSLHSPQMIEIVLQSPYFPQNAELGSTFFKLFSYLTKSPISAQQFQSYISIIDLFLKHPSLSIDGASRALYSYIKGLGKQFQKEQLLELLPLMLASPKVDGGCLNYSLSIVTEAEEMPLENRLTILDLLLKDTRVSSLWINTAFDKAIENPKMEQKELIGVMQLLLKDPRIGAIEYGLMLEALDKSVKEKKLSEDTYNQIQALLFEHPTSVRFFTEKLESFNRSKTEKEFLTLLEDILKQPSTNGSRLWRYFASIVGPFQSHETYRTALRMIAEHPKATEMPLVVRVMIAIERAWAFITFPIHGTLTFLFGWKVSQAITSTLLIFPFTLLRIVGAAFLNLAALK